MTHGEVTLLAPQHAVPAAVAPTVRVMGQQVPQQAGEADFLITVQLLRRALRRWWKVVLPAVLVLGGVSSALICYFLGPRYEAAAWIKIDSTTPFIAYETAHAPAQPELFVQTQIESLRSPMVLGPTLSHPEIAGLEEVRKSDQPLDYLSKKIKIEAIGESELYEVSYRGRHPESAAQVVNTVLDEYFNMLTDSSSSQMRHMVALLETEQKNRSRRIQDLRQRIRKLSNEILGRDPFTGATSGEVAFTNTSLEDLQNRLIATEVEGKVLQAQLDAAKAMLENDPAAALDFQELAEDSPALLELREILTMKRVELNQSRRTAVRKDDPIGRRLAREVQSYDEDLKEAIEIAAEARLNDKIDSLESELASNQLLYDMLHRQYEESVPKFGESGDQSLELEFARSELTREESVFEMIAQRTTAFRTELRAPRRVTLVQRATPPIQPVERLPWKELAFAWVLSLALPLGVALLVERTSRRINEPEQLESQSGLSVVGTIAKLPQHRLLTSVPSTTPSLAWQLFQESVDGLCSTLVLPENRKSFRVLAVCSAIHGEGKTHLSSQLAVSVARALQEPVLLIDGDTRRPSTHRVFDVPREPGLVTVMEGGCLAADAISRESDTQLDIMPAGRLSQPPLNLFANGAFKDLLTELREVYRFIVIDTPPILAASEALTLASEADGAIICARQDYSRETQTRFACQRLASAGVAPLGAVLTAVPSGQYVRRYGSYYGDE